MSKMDSKQSQEDLSQYQMPDALKQEKKYHYRVGYEASTGNKTDPSHTEDGKRT